MKQVRFTAQAELDLEEVGDYIAADNPSLALALPHLLPAAGN